MPFKSELCLFVVCACDYFMDDEMNGSRSCGTCFTQKRSEGCTQASLRSANKLYSLVNMWSHRFDWLTHNHTTQTTLDWRQNAFGLGFRMHKIVFVYLKCDEFGMRMPFVWTLSMKHDVTSMTATDIMHSEWLRRCLCTGCQREVVLCHASSMDYTKIYLYCILSGMESIANRHQSYTHAWATARQQTIYLVIFT